MRNNCWRIETWVFAWQNRLAGPVETQNLFTGLPSVRCAVVVCRLRLCFTRLVVTKSGERNTTSLCSVVRLSIAARYRVSVSPVLQLRELFLD